MQTISPFLLALPIICFAVFVNAYAVNAPFMDDIDGFVTFLVNYRKADGWSGKLYWLLKPNNEHRMFFAKMTTVLLYGLTGTLNFRALIAVVFLCLLGVIALLYRVFRSTRLPLLWFVPVVLILLQPQYRMTAIWSITGLQHVPTILLMLTAFYALTRRTGGAFGGALLLQLLASISMSNGLFGWVAGAVVLALQRQFGRLGIWLALAVGAVWFYFHDYISPQGNEKSFSFLLENPHIVFFAFFTFLGGILDFFPDLPILQRSILPTIGGFVLVAGVLWQIKEMVFSPGMNRNGGSGSDQLRYFFIGAYALLFTNAAVVALLRPRFGYGVMLVSNYMIYPALLTAFLYLNILYLYLNILYLGRNSRLLFRWMQVGLISGVLLWSYSYFRYWPAAVQHKEDVLVYAFNQKHNGIGLGASLGTSFAEEARSGMDELAAAGIYHYPDGPFTPYENQLTGPITAVDSSLHFSVQSDRESHSVEYHPAPDGQRGRRILVVKSDRNTYLFSLKSNAEIRAFYRGHPGTRALALALHPGVYRFGILTPDGQPALRFGNQSFTVPPMRRTL